MAEAPTRWLDSDGEAVRLHGRWTVDNAAAIDRAPRATRHGAGRIDASALEALDSAGALMLLRLAGDDAAALARFDGLDPRKRALLERVAQSSELAPRDGASPMGLPDLLAHIGSAMLEAARQGRRLVAFLGLVLETAARLAPRPARWRYTASVHHLEQTGLDAVPIVALLSFLVGAVVAYLAATVLDDFGAGVYTVELIGYAFLREFGPLLAAILVAGRSGSAFTAQIGAMKNREELDAMRALGLDPIELLVLPRLVALLIALPILGLVGMLAGILGGLVACGASLDISPSLYLARMSDAIDVQHFWVGIAKTPVFAFVIALVGCLEGMKVSGSAESVGEHTTSSVVQSIFLVILFDALFAVYFQQAGW
ncbi:MAG TPA: ABC transporter permease [Xanthomonadales bacterium]|nr:ABC transporter permease [Xanthomonadales bacterium]